MPVLAGQLIESTEANGKIEAANNRIRSLRWERDEALRDCEQLGGQKLALVTQQEELAREKDRLSEQKQQLMRIVEDDLHRHTCSVDGLPARAPVGTEAAFQFP
ncbi:unnamed protein product [Prorocentrum cordatum]|uniref:Uncharacterized protein n=1 Tax=Prorocentrum cordatum TaxID=2364126 RepID=A0ABN9TIE0_9DINO|nr:unnamed protein product [Polarella glacialis]